MPMETNTSSWYEEDSQQVNTPPSCPETLQRLRKQTDERNLKGLKKARSTIKIKKKKIPPNHLTPSRPRRNQRCDIFSNNREGLEDDIEDEYSEANMIEQYGGSKTLPGSKSETNKEEAINKIMSS